MDIVTIALCATICGADSWVDIELFGNCKRSGSSPSWSCPTVSLPMIPSAVFARLDPEQFQRCFMEWVQAVAQVTHGEVVAIDGKTLGAPTTVPWAKRPFTWSTCGPRPMACAGPDQGDEKSNEITAIPKLLQLLEVRRCIITIDAMGCQREMAVEMH